MGQSKTEFARRRREQRENKPTFVAVMDEVTQVVSIHHSVQLGDETAEMQFINGSAVVNISQGYEMAKADPVCGPHLLSTAAVMPGGQSLDTRRAMQIPIETAMAEPLLIVETPDGPVLIDGNHRLYKMLYSGVETFRAYILPLPLLPFVISEERHVSQCAPEILQNLTLESEFHKVMTAMTRHRTLPAADES